MHGLPEYTGHVPIVHVQRGGRFSPVLSQVSSVAVTSVVLLFPAVSVLDFSESRFFKTTVVRNGVRSDNCHGSCPAAGIEMDSVDESSLWWGP